MALALQLADVYTTSRGSKTCRVRGADGLDVFYTSSVEGGLSAPFGMSSFDKSMVTPRVSMDIRLDCEHTLAYFDALDEWAVTYLAANSERIFNKALSMEQIKANYHPCVKRKEPYAPLLKAKVSPESAHFWDENGVERKPPEDWRNARMHFRLQVSHLWIMNGGFGLIINVTDAKVISEGARGGPTAWACPF